MSAKSFGHVCYAGPKTRNHGAATGNQSAPERTQVNCSHSSALQSVKISYNSVCFRIPTVHLPANAKRTRRNIYLCLQVRAITYIGSAGSMLLSILKYRTNQATQNISV